MARIGADRLVWVVFAVALAGAVAWTAMPTAEPSASTTPEPLLGSRPYTGPETAIGLTQTCGVEPDYQGCITGYLKQLLLARGSVAAFDQLENLTRIDSRINTESHPIAHDLGRYAFRVYPNITETLAGCSFKVFQGCLHGALQSYFDSIPTMTHEIVRNTCPVPLNAFEEYACLHGLGHGLMLYTNYDLEFSLESCDALATSFAQGSCWGGVFMENLVGWIDSQSPTAAGGHDHGHEGPPPEYRVNATDPQYPCNSVAVKYQHSCWQLQTSFILRFNGGSFEKAAEVCAAVEMWSDTCFQSLGRDAGPWAQRDPVRGSAYCAHGTERGREMCIRGFISETIHNDANPRSALPSCAHMPSVDMPACYNETATVSRNFMTDAERRVFCGEFPVAYQGDCRQAAAVAT